MKHDQSTPSRPASAAWLRQPYASVWLPLATIFGATLAWIALPADRLAALVAEDGLVENATAVLYVVAMAFVLFCARAAADWKTPTALLIGIAGLLARELDLHRTAANDSVLRVSFYYGHAPLQTRLFALATVGLFLLAVAYLALRHTLPLLRALKQAHPLAVTVLVFFVTGIVAKSFDRGVGVLKEDFGVALSLPAAVWAQSIEETLEACLPLLVMIGAQQVRRARGGPSHPRA